MQHSVYQLVRRAMLVWAIEAVALWLLNHVVPGLHLEGWRAAAMGVAVIALLNALVRPLLLLLTLPFTVLSFGLLTIVFNALIVIVAAGAVPGFTVSNIGTALGVAFGLAAINTLIASVLALNDDESFYRNVVRRIRARSAPQDVDGRDGLIIIEVDGLSATVLRNAMWDGYMPNLKRWLESGSHRVTDWDCGLPSQTSASQAGILYGRNHDIPAFRWYDKDTGKLVVSNHARDAMRIEERISTGDGLLHPDGVSIGNLFSGDAARAMVTMSMYHRRSERVRQTSSIYFSYFLNPYNFIRGFVLVFWEVLIEMWQGLRERMKNVQPRVSRGGSFPWLRAASTVFQRELSVYLLMAEMFSGVPIAYTTFVGYDVLAHHAGPSREDSLRVLRDLDRRIASLVRAAQESPRRYRFVILSDHGQSYGTPFEQRYGTTLEEVVRKHTLETGSVEASIGESEGTGWGHLSALLSEATQYERGAGRAARRILHRRMEEGYVQVGPARHEDADPDARIVVCASGNLGLIYFTSEPGRVPFESIASSYPTLIEGLVEHPGVDFVMAHSEEHGAIVLGKHGVRYLDENRIEGIDPLGHLGPNAPDHLARLGRYPHTGDLVVNGRYDPATGEVTAFENLVGSHGGLGGPQTEAFLMYPSDWSIGADITNAVDLHPVLKGWRDALRQAGRSA